MNRGGIESRVGIFRRSVALNDSALPDMHGDVRLEAFTLSGHRNVGICRIVEIFRDARRQVFFDVPAKRVANVDLLAVYGKLQGAIGLNFCQYPYGRGKLPSRPVKVRHNSDAVYQCQQKP